MKGLLLLVLLARSGGSLVCFLFSILYLSIPRLCEESARGRRVICERREVWEEGSLKYEYDWKYKYEYNRFKGW